MENKQEKMVTIPLSVAELINRAYLPFNVNKVRTAAPEVVEAVKAFKAEILAAGGHP